MGSNSVLQGSSAKSCDPRTPPSLPPPQEHACSGIFPLSENTHECGLCAPPTVCQPAAVTFSLDVLPAQLLIGGKAFQRTDLQPHTHHAGQPGSGSEAPPPLASERSEVERRRGRGGLGGPVRTYLGGVAQAGEQGVHSGRSADWKVSVCPSCRAFIETAPWRRGQGTGERLHVRRNHEEPKPPRVHQCSTVHSLDESSFL